MYNLEIYFITHIFCPTLIPMMPPTSQTWLDNWNHFKKKKLFKAFVSYQQKTLGSLSGKFSFSFKLMEPGSLVEGSIGLLKITGPLPVTGRLVPTNS